MRRVTQCFAVSPKILKETVSLASIDWKTRDRLEAPNLPERDSFLPNQRMVPRVALWKDSVCPNSLHTLSVVSGPLENLTLNPRIFFLFLRMPVLKHDFPYHASILSALWRRTVVIRASDSGHELVLSVASWSGLGHFRWLWHPEKGEVEQAAKRDAARDDGPNRLILGTFGSFTHE